jgi:hypothetical protein
MSHPVIRTSNQESTLARRTMSRRLARLSPSNDGVSQRSSACSRFLTPVSHLLSIVSIPKDSTPDPPIRDTIHGKELCMTINRPTLKHCRQTSPAKISHREGPAGNISSAKRTQEHTENKRPNFKRSQITQDNPRRSSISVTAAFASRCPLPASVDERHPAWDSPRDNIGIKSCPVSISHKRQ